MQKAIPQIPYLNLNYISETTIYKCPQNTSTQTSLNLTPDVIQTISLIKHLPRNPI